MKYSSTFHYHGVRKKRIPSGFAGFTRNAYRAIGSDTALLFLLAGKGISKQQRFPTDSFRKGYVQDRNIPGNTRRRYDLDAMFHEEEGEKTR
jgi:hypothetical protein